jgi:putative oxidoreductase
LLELKLCYDLKIYRVASSKIYKANFSIRIKEKMTYKFFEKNHAEIHAVFRIVVGLLFVGHGAQKLFGWSGGNAVDLMNLFSFNMSSLFVLAGLIEFFGGLLIVFGLFTRTAALVSALDMVGALAIVHLPNGLNPFANGGELALLYLVAFLVILSYGPGKWALDNKLFKRK